MKNRIRSNLLLAAVATALLVLPAGAAEIPVQLPAPDGKPAAADKPVKVYILAGQSNMLGAWQGSRAGSHEDDRR